MPEELTGLDYQERLVIEQIQCLQRAHEAQMAPLIKRLSNIRSMRPQPRLVFTAEQADSILSAYRMRPEQTQESMLWLNGRIIKGDLAKPISAPVDAPLPTEPPAA